MIRGGDHGRDQMAQDLRPQRTAGNFLGRDFLAFLGFSKKSVIK